MNDDRILSQLFSLLTEHSVVLQLAAISARLERNLAANPSLPQSWESVSPTIFGSSLPESILSCWVFVLRAHVFLGAERHPNSHQRTVALSGRAMFEVLQGDAWTPHPIDAASDTMRNRWVSIPESTWHRIRVGEANLVIASFHTVPVQMLIEEKPVGDDLTVTRQHRYSKL